MNFLGQKGKQIRSLGRPEGTIRRILAARLA